MLTARQKQFRDDFLAPVKQKLYFVKNLPMGLITGIKLVQLTEELSVSEVPYHWWNKNPFDSMYFAVQSMAAELSTAAPAMMALQGFDESIALIIIDLRAEFIKKAKTKITFNCQQYGKLYQAISQLKTSDDTSAVTIKTIGRDVDGEEVAIFYFTWSFKIRSGG